MLISSIFMICRAFLTVFQSFLSLIEDTMAHCPWNTAESRFRKSAPVWSFWRRPDNNCYSYSNTAILGWGSCTSGGLSPGPAGAARRHLLPPLSGRRCESFFPRDSDAPPSTSPAGSSGYGPRRHPPTGTNILKTAAVHLAETNAAYAPVDRFI